MKMGFIAQIIVILLRKTCFVYLVFLSIKLNIPKSISEKAKIFEKFMWKNKLFMIK